MRYTVKQYSDFPRQHITDKAIKGFNVLKEAMEFSKEHNIQKDKVIHFDKLGRKIINYKYEPNERYYVENSDKY